MYKNGQKAFWKKPRWCWHLINISCIQYDLNIEARVYIPDLSNSGCIWNISLFLRYIEADMQVIDINKYLHTSRKLIQGSFR